MPSGASRTAITTDHPGSTQQEIDDEPDWGFGHNHRIGYVNSDDRFPGFTHSNDEPNPEVGDLKASIEGTVAEEQKKHHGELINFREVMQDKTDVHLKRKEDHPPGWRFFVNVTEDWVKKEQRWPANIKAEEKKKQKEKEEKEKKEKQGDDKNADGDKKDQKDKSSGKDDQKQQDAKKDGQKPQDGGKDDQKDKSDQKGKDADKGEEKAKPNEPAKDGEKKQEAQDKDSKSSSDSKPQTSDDNKDDASKKSDKPAASSSSDSTSQKSDSKDDAPKKDDASQKNDKPAPSSEKQSGSKASNDQQKQDSTSGNASSDQSQSDQEHKGSTSSADHNKPNAGNKSQAAKEAEAKHPGGAQEQHTYQKGQHHYWQDDDSDEADWRRQKDPSRPAHNTAFRRSQSTDSDEGYQSGEKSDSDYQNKDDKGKDKKTEYQKLREKYSPEEIALLRHLQNEAKYEQGLEQNDGKQVSPVAKASQVTEIDVNDQFTPDNWIPRSTELTRLTGKHPLNAEPPLTKLFEAGLITPNELHYVRNHGAVPRLYWETHTLDIENGQLVLTMDELENNFSPINIAVALGCDGNRRGEVNLIKKSKGFSWGASAISCAYWKGAPLRDVLLAAGVDSKIESSKRRWVNFEGSDELTDGKYATCIPLEYALDPSNDVIIAYEMNNVKLPPDHGFPCRVIIPSWVGGRCVKWLARIWTSDHENDSHYHIWDNRVLPSFVTEKDGPFASTMFRHASTACNEQNLNSVIVKPAQGERLSFRDAANQDTYRVEGFAYDGGGHEIQRVELSLDQGKTWLYCTRRFPERPVRHGNKFWTWLHWYIDVDMGHLLQAESLVVRAMNVFKNFQPENLTWNLMGMMNNCWYKVKHDLDSKPSEPNSDAAVIFRHPVDAIDSEGWMKPSLEVQLNAAKADTGVPDKQFTRQEIEKHNNDGDCWLVINSKVYDATSVLDWHPGGKASILGYAGKLTAETTSSFESIHDDYATKKLSECIIGKLTDKAANFIKQQAKQQAKERANYSKNTDIFLKKQTWQPVKLISRKMLSEDTGSYTFQLPDKSKKLGMSTCQHIQFGIHMKDKMLIRSYTPTRPILQKDEDGTFELVVKIYFPTEQQPGGAFGNFIDTMPIGESVDVRGPTGEIKYLGNGKFDIEGEERQYDKVSLILGGSGITPGYQLLERVMREKDDKTQVRVIDANKSEKDILLKEELEEMQGDQIKITHVLSHPSDDWKGLKGHVNEDIIKDNCFAPEKGSAVFLCGPPAMIQKAALPALKDWGYEEDVNCFGF